jgi:hypothetical protein
LVAVQQLPFRLAWILLTPCCRAATLSLHCCCYSFVTTDEERQTVALKGKISKDSLTDLIKSEKLPPTIEFNDQNSQKIFSSGIEKQLLLIANEKDLKADADLFKAYRKVGAAILNACVLICGIECRRTVCARVLRHVGVMHAQ